MKAKGMDLKILKRVADRAQLIGEMLQEHLNELMEQGIEVCFYVCRFPLDSIRIVQYQGQPVRKIFLRDELLISIELKPNPLDPMVVDTWLDGSASDLMTFTGSPLVAIQ